VKASDKFKNPTKRVNEMWQTDFTQFKVIGWGWYYLCTVMSSILCKRALHIKSETGLQNGSPTGSG
jgi:hypothetical protein